MTSFAYRRKRVSVVDRRKLHTDRCIFKNPHIKPIEINQNTYFSINTKGSQRPDTQWDDNQINCKGKVTGVNNIDINLRIDYEDDQWLIQETTIITDGNKIKTYK